MPPEYAGDRNLAAPANNEVGPGDRPMTRREQQPRWNCLRDAIVHPVFAPAVPETEDHRRSMAGSRSHSVSGANEFGGS